ncbi:MAG: hypothetical protein ACOYBE_11455 [Blautia sp.]
MGKQQWFILLLVGILLAVIALPTGKKTTEKTASLGSLEPDRTEETSSGEKQQMERDLENLLSKVEGVGEVRVLLTIKEDSGSLYGSSQSTPSVTGVLIAASGADNLSVVENIQEAVQALFQVEAHKIKVMKMK